MLSNLLKIAILLLIFNSCTQQGTSEKQAETELRNRDNLADFIDKGWNQKDPGSVDMHFSDEFVRRVNKVVIASDKQELLANMQVYFIGFPDLEIVVDHQMSDGNQVYLSWTITGTNTGKFGDLIATGKKIRVSGVSRVEFNPEGKIVFEDVFYNELSLLQQMGHTLNPPVLE